MRVVGIDPGLKATGYGFVEESDGKIVLLETGTIEPKQKDPLGKRIERIYGIVNDLLAQYKPQLLVLEKLYAHHQHPTTASLLGHVRGAICLITAQRNVELAEYSVKRIRKALTGNGNATKVQTQRVVADLLRIDANKLTLDASDALALALGHLSMNRRLR
ncbi:MAG TPA: crossover junction endodeoxyribonuclease RuvC [Candidatus Omnitrophota bacterium]|nr:crossover junction endodeoxyribonuclease RuvC [Candidatus Omnitrophota bacterium]